MAKAKLPAFFFYPGDWKKHAGVQALEPLSRLVWFECLLIMHDSEERGYLVLNGKPMSTIQIARAINLDNQIVSTALTDIQACGVCGVRGVDGAIYSRRMVRDEVIRQIRIKAGKLGGNPNLVKQKPTTPVKQKPTLSSSISSTYSYSEEETHTPTPQPKEVCESLNQTKVDILPREQTYPESLDTLECRSAINRWAAHLKSKHKREFDQIAVEALLMSYADRPQELISNINYSIMGGWKMICVEPVQNENSKTHTPEGYKKSASEIQIERHVALLKKIRADEEREENEAK